jgi:asparagine synthase (glutamine-hydrolysing)
MCGLAGIVRRDGLGPRDAELIRRMNRIQRHRGPDDQGVYTDDRCALGHQRLAIIDLSSAGHQPFFSDDGRYLLVYNGEIYNYIELRAELRELGWHFNTQTDTEVLLKAYLAFGADCLARFNGMFAFVIYDRREHTLFMARDRVGIKPLYYMDQDAALCFASEIKALCCVPGRQPHLNYQALFDYLVFNRTDVWDETFLADVKRIPKGCYAVWERGNMRIRRWWNPETFRHRREHRPLNEILEQLEHDMVSAVRLRMRSDVPVGSCLSGGLDSSILVGILFQKHGAPDAYPTFTAAFGNHPLDETQYIDHLNRRYPFRNQRTFPTAETARQQLAQFVYCNDEPTTNPSFYSQFEVMRLARANGVTVLLDGQGGDESFAGYQYFHGFNLYGLLCQRRLGRFSRELISSLRRRQDISAYQTLAFQISPHTVRKKLLAATVPYVGREFFEHHIDHSRIYREFFDAQDLNHSLVRHFQYKLEHLLRMEDRNSMAFSLEARVPYLDYRIIEFVLGLPDELKLKNGETKYLQKRALGKYTIPEILNRRDKIGFGTPGDDWMQTSAWQDRTRRSYAELAEAFPDVFEPRRPLPAKGFDRWKINNLAVWKDLFL